MQGLYVQGRGLYRAVQGRTGLYRAILSFHVYYAKTKINRNNNDIEMYAGDDYVYGEEDDEQDSAVCSPSVNASVSASQCELSAAFTSGARPQSGKARECPGRKRRIVKVTQWSASARANMIKALRERVT